MKVINQIRALLPNYHHHFENRYYHQDFLYHLKVVDLQKTLLTV